MLGSKLARRAIVLTTLIGSFQSASAASQGVFHSMAGSWKGPGRIELGKGGSEALLCKAYYTAKQGDLLGIAIRCASPSLKIELRAKLAVRGDQLIGSWEERTFNASGSVSGRAKDDEISLSIEGGGFTASMLVNHGGGRQTVLITANGAAFTKVTLSLARQESQQRRERSEG